MLIVTLPSALVVEARLTTVFVSVAVVCAAVLTAAPAALAAPALIDPIDFRFRLLICVAAALAP